MYAIAVLAILILYVWVCFGIGWFVYRKGEKLKFVNRWLLVSAVVVAYNYPLANYVLPPIFAMDRYCETAGLHLYKSPEQWKQENLAEITTITDDKETVRTKPINGTIYEVHKLNSRIARDSIKTPTESKYVHRYLEILVDLQRNEILVEKIDFDLHVPQLYGKSSCFERTGRSNSTEQGRKYLHYQKAYKNINTTTKD